MIELATAKQHQKIQRVAIDKGYKDGQEFITFNAPKLFGYQRSLANLTKEEAERLIIEGE